MTREEAIEVLKKTTDNTIEMTVREWEAFDLELAEAIDMAIEALSAEAVQGEWILVKGSNGKDYHKCSKCLHTQDITGVKNYCAVCGTRMKSGDTE